MKLSKKSRYGLKALIDLAVHGSKGHVALNHIAERNSISPQYLEQVFAGLRKAGLVKSVKGPQGGYLLALDARDITAAAVVQALDGSYELEPEAVSDSGSGRGASSAIQKLVIDRVNTEMDALLTDITLQELAEEARAQEEYASDMYYI